METADEDRLARRRDELQRIVFGTPGGAQAEAEEELVAVERELAARRGDEPDVVGAATLPDAVIPEAIADRASRPRGRRRLIATAVVLVLIGVGVALSGGVREALSPPRGVGIFERAPSAAELALVDRVAQTASVSADDALSLRSLGRVFGYDFWAYRNGHQVCLLSQRPFFFDWVRTCASHHGFERFGLSRRISGGDIRSIARPQRIQPDDVVVVSWGPDSIEVEWYVEPAESSRGFGVDGTDPMTYEEWSSLHLAERPDGS